MAGLMYEAFGPRLMYRIISGTAFLYALFLAVTMETMRLAEHCRRQKKKEPGESRLSPELNYLCSFIKQNMIRIFGLIIIRLDALLAVLRVES